MVALMPMSPFPGPREGLWFSYRGGSYRGYSYCVHRGGSDTDNIALLVRRSASFVQVSLSVTVP